MDKQGAENLEDVREAIEWTTGDAGLWIEIRMSFTILHFLQKLSQGITQGDLLDCGGSWVTRHASLSEMGQKNSYSFG